MRVSFTNCQQLLLLARRQRMPDAAILLTAIKAVHGYSGASRKIIGE